MYVVLDCSAAKESCRPNHGDSAEGGKPQQPTGRIFQNSWLVTTNIYTHLKVEKRKICECCRRFIDDCEEHCGCPCRVLRCDGLGAVTLEPGVYVCMYVYIYMFIVFSISTMELEFMYTFLNTDDLKFSSEAQ